MYVGSKERKERLAKRFQACPAPMMAKVIMRDELIAHGMTAEGAAEAVAAMVQRLAIYEYHIEQAQD